VTTERGEIRQHINVFVDGVNIRFAGGLSAPVADGAEIIILPAVSGG
jgi:molybdopterin synthase sulfur carrier subunit